MYIAEMKGKLSPREEQKEDILTSNVFSFFKYSKREIFLNQLIQTLGLDIETDELIKAEFVFWPKFEDGTEPDLVIIVGKYYLLFEAKLNSSFETCIDLTKHQLMREIRGGRLEARNLNKIFRLVVVTAHYSKYKFLNEIADISLNNILWINWHQIALIIYNIINNGETLDLETFCFAEDLYNLLVKKKLRKYAGVEILKQTLLMDKPSLHIFFDSSTAQYRGDFFGFIETLKNFPTMKTINEIFWYKETVFFVNLFSDNLLHEQPDTIFLKVVDK